MKIYTSGQLARDLSEGEAWAQAGLCCVAVARCEQSLANPTTEVAALTQAARYFLKVSNLSCFVSYIQYSRLTINIYPRLSVAFV